MAGIRKIVPDAGVQSIGSLWRDAARFFVRPVRGEQMKPRIKIDTLMMATAMALTFLVFQVPALYPASPRLDDGLNFIGVLLIMQGIFFRMAARGHKKRFSQQSKDLVTSGPYKIVRNPMYLGTYLIGAGCFVILWPWWFVPIYTIIFYRRFRIQIMSEEKLLKKMFGEVYDRYCLAVPRLFPDLFGKTRTKMRDIFPKQDLWTTKEKRAIVPVLIVVMLMQTLKEKMIYGVFNPGVTVLITLTAVGVFGLIAWIRYQER